MKLNISIAGFVLFNLLVINTLAQVGKPYPAMSGLNLLEKNIHIPPKNGKVTLVALAYSEDSEEYLKAWRQPLFDLFIQAPGTQLFDFEPYDANIKFVVLLTGLKKAVSGKVRSKMEDNVKDHWKEHIVIVKGKTLDSYPDLDLGKGKDDRKKPYFYLIDQSGKIVWHTSGNYSKTKQQEIESKLHELIGDNQFKD